MQKKYYKPYEKYLRNYDKEQNFYHSVLTTVPVRTDFFSGCYFLGHVYLIMNMADEIILTAKHDI